MTLGVRAGAEVLSLVLLALTTIWIGRALGPAHYGYFALTLTLIQIAGIALNLGFSNAGSQRIANDPEETARTWWAVVGGRTMLCAIALPFAAAIALLAPIDGELRQLLLVGEFALVVLPFRSEWLLVGRGWGTALAAVRVAATGSAALLAVALVHGPGDAGLAPLVLVAQASSAASMSVAFASRRVHLTSGSAIRAALPLVATLGRAGLHYLRTDVAVFIFASSDRLFLAVFSAPTVLGLYDAAYRLIQPFYAISTVVGDTMYLDLARSFGTARLRFVLRRYVDLMSIATIPVGFFCAVNATGLVTAVYGQGYAQGASYLAILGWVITLGYAAGTAILPMAAWNRPREYGNATTGGGIADLALNVALIPPFAGFGAAIATVGANIVTTIQGIAYFGSVTDYPLLRDYAEYLVAAAAGAIAALAANAVIPGHPVVGVIGFGLAYLALVVALRFRSWSAVRTVVDGERP